MKAAIITFPGSNCDRDSADAVKKVGGTVKNIWYNDTYIEDDIDLIILPGGFSYGDYLRSGALASVAPIISEVKRHAIRGVNIIGICNGFQILTEIGLLKGALIRNKNLKFICKQVSLKVCNNNSIFTSSYQKNQIIKIPIANMDGNYFANSEILKDLQDNNNIALKYCSEQAIEDEDSNPNGSIDNIAAIFDNSKKILGMMPHPERAIGFNDYGSDGIKIFNNI
ncbi:phosphoribosylformylglycinamidine synthase subunit PurQ [Rickettsiales bacterium]|nr:phosphoribosylformylglycinamidine synthase subunit PurQ [Rickettsiales bacterium]